MSIGHWPIPPSPHPAVLMAPFAGRRPAKGVNMGSAPRPPTNEKLPYTYIHTHTYIYIIYRHTHIQAYIHTYGWSDGFIYHAYIHTYIYGGFSFVSMTRT